MVDQVKNSLRDNKKTSLLKKNTHTQYITPQVNNTNF